MVGVPWQGVVLYIVGKGESPKRSEQSSDGTGLEYQEEKVYFVLELHVSLSVSSHPSFPLARLVNVIFCEGTSVDACGSMSFTHLESISYKVPLVSKCAYRLLLTFYFDQIWRIWKDRPQMN